MKRRAPILATLGALLYGCTTTTPETSPYEERLKKAEADIAAVRSNVEADYRSRFSNPAGTAATTDLLYIVESTLLTDRIRQSQRLNRLEGRTTELENGMALRAEGIAEVDSRVNVLVERLKTYESRPPAPAGTQATTGPSVAERYLNGQATVQELNEELERRRQTR